MTLEVLGIIMRYRYQVTALTNCKKSQTFPALEAVAINVDSLRSRTGRIDGMGLGLVKTSATAEAIILASIKDALTGVIVVASFSSSSSRCRKRFRRRRGNRVLRLGGVTSQLFIAYACE